MVDTPKDLVELDNDSGYTKYLDKVQMKETANKKESRYIL